MRPYKKCTGRSCNRPSCLTPTSAETGSDRESEYILLVMSIYHRLQIWIVIGVVHTVLSVQVASVRLSEAALRLYIEPMQGEVSHKQELASRWVRLVYTYRSPGRRNELSQPAYIHPGLGSAVNFEKSDTRYFPIVSLSERAHDNKRFSKLWYNLSPQVPRPEEC